MLNDCLNLKVDNKYNIVIYIKYDLVSTLYMEGYLLSSVYTLHSHPLLLRAKRIFSFSDIVLLKSIKTHLYGTKRKLILTNMWLFFPLTKNNSHNLTVRLARDTWSIFQIMLTNCSAPSIYTTFLWKATYMIKMKVWVCRYSLRHATWTVCRPTLQYWLD